MCAVVKCRTLGGRKVISHNNPNKAQQARGLRAWPVLDFTHGPFQDRWYVYVGTSLVRRRVRHLSETTIFAPVCTCAQNAQSIGQVQNKKYVPVRRICEFKEFGESSTEDPRECLSQY